MVIKNPRYRNQRQGRAWRTPRGEGVGGSRLRVADVLALRQRAAAGETARALAAEYDVAYTTVLGILRRVSWAWLPDDTEGSIR